MRLIKAATSPSLIPWLAAALACCIASLGVYYADRVESRRYQQELRSETLEQLSAIRAEIEGRLSSDLQLFAGLVVQISLHPDISKTEIDNTMGALMTRGELVRSIGVSEGFEIRHVYPLLGNEAAIGVNYLANEGQREPVLRAVSTRQSVLAGPVELIQGGQALIGRLPVFTALPWRGKPAGQFWGIVSVVLNLDQLYQETGLNRPGLPIDISIRGRDGLGQFGDAFLGNPSLFDSDSVHLDLSLPGGRWRMAARPNHRMLARAADRRQLLVAMGLIVVLLFGLAAFVISRQLQQQKAIIEVQERTREQVWYAATHDRLTGVANRQLFNEQLRQFIAQARRHRLTLAVLFLDLDRFKEINDSFGHRVGDLFLQALSKRLSAEVRESEFLARLGGDEFAIIAENVSGIDAVASLAQRITSVLDQPFEIEHNKLHAGVSIGIALYPDDGDAPDTLLQHADLAMYTAKENLLSSYAFFEDSMNLEVQQRKQLTEDMRTGMESNQFSLLYQPVVDIRNARVIGVEALARWHHPQRGAVSPAVFIPAAERSGLIIPFGDWVLRRATEEAAQWQPLSAPVTLSINLSPIQLHRGDPLKLVEETLQKTGFRAQNLDIEITESAIMEDVDKATDIVRRLRERGVSVTIDDFGTGYSSLSHLRHLPVNRIKIDTSFVRLIGKDHHSEAIIKAILFLSQTLNVRVTAEGVETEQQLAFLRALGCSEIQGFYFARPTAAGQIPESVAALKEKLLLTHVVGD